MEKKWNKLTTLIGVPLDERRRLKTMATNDNDYEFALEEGLQWWINNGTGLNLSQLLRIVETVT